MTPRINRPYTPFDIIWIKNISNREIGHAYMELNEDEFPLHFPSHHKGNVLSPKIGELILLHQNISGRKVFTHLVAPVDDIRIEEDRENYRYARRVKIIAKTDIDTAIPISSTLWNEINFQGISQGNACEIANISTIGVVDVLLQNVWNKFIPYFTPSFESSTSFVSNTEAEIENSDQDISVIEGMLRLVTHYARERDRNIVRTKKKQAIDKGILFCEVCDFSFIEKFGMEFIECHHRTPISQSGVTETTLDDLGLVCANCHRMLHKQFEGQFLSIEELRRKINLNI